MGEPQKLYRASQTMTAFHQSKARRRGIRGPIGSGKSTAMCMELLLLGQRQAPMLDGVRRTRFGVIRNTYQELQDTTIKTWDYWLGDITVIEGRPPTGIVRFEDAGGPVEMELFFRSLDRPDDVKKLLSLELSGAWFNEAREAPWVIVETLDDRIGRYPPANDGGCTQPALLMDTNSPPFRHWWYEKAEKERPEGWVFFDQPPAVLRVGDVWVPNPEAENLENLEQDFYKTRIQGKDEDHIRVYYANEYGVSKDGQPVYPEYQDAVHSREFEVVPQLGGIRAWDFGLTPCCLFAQVTASGQIRIFDEVQAERAGIERFSEFISSYTARHWGAVRHWEDVGDPSGDYGGDLETTAFDVLQAGGVDIRGGVQDVARRIESVRHGLSTLIDAQPAILVHKRCELLRQALAGMYRYRRVAVAGEDRYHDKPDKGPYSHIGNALEYLASDVYGDVLGMPRWREELERERREELEELEREGYVVGGVRVVPTRPGEPRQAIVGGEVLQKSYSTR